MKELEDRNSNEVMLLVKEAGLCATCLEQGMTALRKASFAKKWNYYQAFFLLSIGVERLLKLILIIKHVVDNDQLPDNEVVKKYGHDIEGLFNKVNYDLKPTHMFCKSDPLHKKILVFLKVFALGSRYYNSDALSGRTGIKDPLHEWKDIQNIIKTKHIVDKGIKEFEGPILSIMQSKMYFIMTNEKDENINDVNKYFNETKHLDKIQGYSVYYIFQLVNFLVELLIETSSKKRMLPYFEEFFPLLRSGNLTKEDIIRRKNWNYLTNTR